MAMPLIDLAGQTFGYWTVLARREDRWLCRCICGTEKLIAGHHLRDRHTTSCGCKRGRHQHTSRRGGSSPTYRSWANMVARCTQPSNPAYEHYQRRGIRVCERWRDFANFLADMGERPSLGHTLDRIDNDGNYEPDNVRWATKRDQGNNRLTNVRVTYQGKEYTLAELARATGVSKELIRSRLRRSKQTWTVEGALSTPKGHKGIKAR